MNKTKTVPHTPHTAYRIPLYVVCLLLASCAKIVAPTGGPKDITPPKVIAEKPENGSVNFTEKVIKITFDEFVTLNNPTENVIFSPPLNKRIDYSTQGKSALVKMNDTLQKNTTYNIFFSDCIQDFHEGNKLSGYNFAFSTGDSIDKHQLFGNVENAESSKAEVGVFVLLYDNDIDSLPLTSRPNYITKTDAQGNFSFLHLKPKKYKLFALKDINSDLKYNLPNELIAFADNLVETTFYKTDSLHTTDTATFVKLRMFQEADTLQQLLYQFNPQNGVYRFAYKLPIKSFDIQLKSSIDIDYFSIINPTRDTLTMYLKTFFTDSAMVYLHIDSIRMDTLELRPFKTVKRQVKNQQIHIQTLNVTLTNKDHLYAPTLLNFSYPVKPADSIKMFVIATQLSGKDTTTIYANIPDNFVMQLPIPFAFEPKINYTVWIPYPTFYGYDETTHDTLLFTLSKKTEKDYGNLIIHYKIDDNNDADFIVELLNSSQKIIYKEIISHSKTIEYQHLLPGSYRIKVIEDLNKNGKWDTGNYRKKIQPEKIFTINKEINVRGFWDVEEDIELRAP